MPKNPVWEHLWTVNMLKGLKHCSNLHGGIFVGYFDNIEKKISLKSCVLVVCETLRLFVKLLTTDDKYSVSVKTSV